MFKRIRSVGYFSTTYDLIKSQFEGNGSCFYRFYLLPDSNILPETYARDYFKQFSDKQIDLDVNKYHSSTVDYPFDDELYQLTPYVGLKHRSFLFSIFSEVPQVVNSVLITGYITNQDGTITELPFCQLILPNGYILDQGSVFDSEIKLFYPIPVRFGNVNVRTIVPELFQSSVTDETYTFSCSTIFSSSFKIECFHFFDLFNYYNYSLAVEVQNKSSMFTVNDLTNPELEREIRYVEKFSNKLLRFDIKIPLSVTTSVEKLKLKNSNDIGVVTFKPIIVCENYVNVGRDYLTVDIEVNITRWLNYLSFMIRL